MRYLGTLSPDWPRKGAESGEERHAYWQVRAVMGPVWPDDFGKRVYEVDDPAGPGKPTVIQVENADQRDRRLSDS